MKRIHKYEENNLPIAKKLKTEETDWVAKALEKIKLDPQNARLYNSLGNVYFELKDYSKAITSYQKAIALSPNDDIYYCNLGGSYFRQGKYFEAIVEFKKAMMLEQRYASEEYELMICSYEELIKLNPNDLQLHIDLADSNFALRNYSQAIKSLKKALGLDPNNTELYNNLGNMYSMEGKQLKAIESFKKAIELGPNVALYYNNLGNIYFKQEKYFEAIVECKNAINLDPNSAICYNNLGNCYSKLGNHLQAIVEFNKAIELDPKNPILCNSLGNNHFRLGNYQEAIFNILKAIELETNNPSPYLVNLGNAIMEFTNTTHIERFNLTKCAMDQYANADNLERIKYFLKNHLGNSGISNFKKCAAPALKSLGDKFLSQGKFLEALKMYEEYLAIEKFDYNTQVNAYFAAKKSLELPIEDIYNIYIKNNINFLNFPKNCPQHFFLKDQMQIHYLKATKYLPYYADMLIKILNPRGLGIEEIASKILSFLAPEKIDLQLIKLPGEILKLLGSKPSIEIEELKAPIESNILGENHVMDDANNNYM